MGDKIFIKRDETKTKTESGLHLPDEAIKKSLTGTVTATGTSTQFVKVGDRVTFSENCLRPMKIEEEEHEMCREMDIIAIFS